MLYRWLVLGGCGCSEHTWGWCRWPGINVCSNNSAAAHSTSGLLPNKPPSLLHMQVLVLLGGLYGTPVLQLLLLCSTVLAWCRVNIQPSRKCCLPHALNLVGALLARAAWLHGGKCCCVNVLMYPCVVVVAPESQLGWVGSA
jgi:hypothetical protein